MNDAQRVEAAANRRTDRVSSDRWNIFILKVFAPVLWITAAVGLFGSDPLTWRFIFAAPLLAIAFFHMSLAVVRISDGRVSYRRVLRWAELTPDDIVSCGVVWPPMIGFIKVRHQTLFLRKMFFVLDKRTGIYPFRRNRHKLLQLLDSYRSHIPQKVGTLSHENPGRLVWLRLVLGFSAGFAVSALRIWFEHQSSQSAPVGTFESTLVNLFGFLSNPPMAFILLCSLSVISVFMRQKDTAWTIALLAGLCGPFVRIH